jgi:hypothetical protein
MGKPLFLKIGEAVENFNEYCTLNRNVLGKLGVRPIVKITDALQMLA